MSKVLPISEARKQLPELVEQASQFDETYEITVNGYKKAVLISTEEYESMQETLEVLTIPGIIDQLKKSEAQIDKQEIVSLDDL